MCFGYIPITYGSVTNGLLLKEGRFRKDQMGVSMDIQFDSLRDQRYWNVFSYGPQISALKRRQGQALNPKFLFPLQTRC